MGIINDGSISGVLPSGSEAFAVHYPGYPSSIERAIETLGSTERILKARSDKSNKLELHFRPEDPYSHPVFGELRPCNNLLLKISKKKIKDTQNIKEHNQSLEHASAKSSHLQQNRISESAKTQESIIRTECGSSSSASQELKEQGEDEARWQLSADVVSRIPEAYYFNGMVDYQHMLAIHADVAQRKKRKWTEVDPNFEKRSLIDVDQEDLMILLPPLFSSKDVPEKVVLKLPGDPQLKKKQDAVSQQRREMEIEECLAIDFNIKEIPKEVNWQKSIPKDSDMWQWQMAVCELFNKRPIWIKSSLAEHLHDRGLNIGNRVLRRLLYIAAYYFSNGPYLRLWIRKGYDPRKDPESRIYQRMDFRVPPSLRSYCDTIDVSGEKIRWEDICAFRVFPRKCQVLLHLYELKDDYIQQEIRKPITQENCSLQSGWFPARVVDCLRLRVAQRFLFVYPEPGAESLLKFVSKRFEKAKRSLLTVKDPDANKEGKQDNNEVLENEDTENNDDIEHEDDIEDEMEDDNLGEDVEVDADEVLDLADQDADFALQPDAGHGNISKDYLQDLFGSFPFGDVGGDGMLDANDTYDGTYQIYEQYSDDNYSGDEDY